MRRRVLTKKNIKTPMPVALYDSVTGEKFQTTNIGKYSSSRYTPIGVVVIPTSHDVYGDGSCGILSLKTVKSTIPVENETGFENLSWNGYNVDISELTNYNRVCKVGIESGAMRDNAIVNNIIESVSYSSYLPSDSFTKNSIHTKAIDGTYYYYVDSSWNDCIPSPYLNDGTRNPIYYQTTSPSVVENALSDFNGKNNTQILCSKAIAQSDWKTATKLIIYDGQDGKAYYPAPCACWRYFTIGTNQGDWYLPAIGELGYVCVRRNSINITNLLLAQNYNINYKEVSYVKYWSSTEIDSNDARVIDFYNGCVMGWSKYSFISTYAFTHLVLPIKN